MERIEKIKADLKQILSEKRYNHSIGAMNAARKLAIIYEINPNIAELTALTHDIAKELPVEKRLEYVKENNIQIDEIEKENTGLLHAKIGADMVKNKYGFTEDMQKAIEYHTTAHTNMTTLAKIVFVADKIEENRVYKDVQAFRELAKKDLDECMLYMLNYIIEKNIVKGLEVHPNSILVRDELQKLKQQKG